MNGGAGNNGNPCTPGANGCVSLKGQGGYNDYCCYLPKSGSLCAADYGGKAQCLPQ